MSEFPALPAGKEWPAHMLGDEPIKARLRATYARIANSVAGDRERAAEKTRALDWCRANGNPHLETEQ